MHFGIHFRCCVSLQIGLTAIVAVLVGLLFYHLQYDLEGVHNRTGFLFFSVVYFSLASLSSIGVLMIEARRVVTVLRCLQ